MTYKYEVNFKNKQGYMKTGAIVTLLSNAYSEEGKKAMVNALQAQFGEEVSEWNIVKIL